MAEREKLEVGNNTVEADGEFADGFCNGSLYYYDTNHQLPRPLTSEAICAFIMDNLFDRRATSPTVAGVPSVVRTPANGRGRCCEGRIPRQDVDHARW